MVRAQHYCALAWYDFNFQALESRQPNQQKEKGHFSRRISLRRVWCKRVRTSPGKSTRSESRYKVTVSLVCCTKIVHSRHSFKCSSISSTTDTSRSPSI